MMQRLTYARALAVAAAGVLSVVAGWTVASPAPAAPATPHLTPRPVSVSLVTSDAKVPTSTGRHLRLELDADQSSGATSAADVVVTLSDGPIDESETHTWTFPDSPTALKVTSAGNGTLKVPATRISPYGDIAVKITSSGSPTARYCNGRLAEKDQRVKVTGTFLFNTRSSGSQSWGKVGSARKPFTFATPNFLEWSYRPGGAQGCAGSKPVPCEAALFWDAPSGDVDVSGAVINGVALIVGTRIVHLATPARATREDALFATGPTPQLTTTPDPSNPGASNASLPVSGSGAASGSATLTSSTSSTPEQVPCGTSGGFDSVSQWTQAAYANGTPPLTVGAQVFGPISVTDNAAATILDFTTGS